MSNYLAIATVTAVLKNEVEEILATMTIGGNPSVTTTRPVSNESSSDGPKVNIYLYQVTPNSALRNQDLPVRGSSGSFVAQPQVALDLHYLFSFYGDDSELMPQRMLGSVISHLDARPVLTEAMITSALNAQQFANILDTSDLGQALEKIKLTPVALPFEELSRLWTNLFQGPHALSISYIASVVLIDAEVTPPLVLPVQEVGVHVGTMSPLHITETAIEIINNLPTNGNAEPILEDIVLVVQGEGFQNETIEAHIDGKVVEFEQRGPEQFTLSILNQRAGVHTLQIVRPWLLGNSPTSHPGICQTSNLMTFVLQPIIEEAPTYANSAISIKVTPAVEPSQLLVLLLVKKEPSIAPNEDSSSRFDGPVLTTATSDFIVPVADIDSGVYQVRVLVDGVPSEWTLDSNGEILQQVTIP